MTVATPAEVRERLRRETRLGFRAFFRVRDTPQFLRLVDEQFSGWLRHKRYPVDDIDGVGSFALRDTVDLHVQRRDDRDGSHTVRRVLTERKDGGSWRTVLTVHEDAHHQGWVWLDLYPPSGLRIEPPKLARQLVEVLHGRDGLAVLEASATVLGADDLAYLLAVLRDPDRRGIVFVAGTPADYPLAAWRDHVDSLLKKSVGLATTYVLDADATRELNDHLPDSHVVGGAHIRTFLPGVDLSDPLDGRRHRFLSPRTIVEKDAQHLRSVLGNQAVRELLEGPLPREAVRVDRLLRRDFDEALVSDLAVPAVTPVAATPAPVQHVSGAEPQTPERAVVEAGSANLPVEPEVAETPDSGLKRALSGIMELVTGTREVTVSAMESLAKFVSSARQRENAQEKVRRRLEELQLEIEQKTEQIEILQEELDDEVLEKEQAEAERLDAVRRLRFYLGELEPRFRGEAEAALNGLEADDWPETFETLLERLPELTYLEFTGSREPALDLDNKAKGYSWAKKSWEALLALNDYAHLRSEGIVNGDVHAYLGNTPPGRCGFSRQRHAATESEDVKRNPKFASPRRFPVPREVSSSGEAQMWAHFKIANSKSISPRLHYLDCVSEKGKIYVGYLGAHLPNSQTN